MTFKSNRKVGYKRSNNFSNGKMRNKGNLSQQYNKYLKLAKDAFTSGDRIQSEYYYQYTDHYHRMMIEMGIAVEENDLNLDAKTQDNKENIDQKPDSSENIDLEIKDNKLGSDNTNSIDEEKLETIESIPFIAEPAKKKRATRTK